MPITDRQKKILKALQEHRTASVSDLARRCDVTEPSIRSDLDRLEVLDLVQRYHGGARLVRVSAYEQRLSDNQQQKDRIARKALTHISEEDTLFLDSGTTLLRLARLLIGFERLTIVTNSVPIANQIGREQENSAVLAGGVFNFSEQCCEGVMTEKFLDNFNAAKAFIGADSVDADKGLYSNGVSMFGYVKKIIDSAKMSILLVDSSKFDKVGAIKICDVADIDVIITDGDVDPHIRQKLVEHGVKVDIV